MLCCCVCVCDLIKTGEDKRCFDDGGDYEFRKYAQNRETPTRILNPNQITSNNTFSRSIALFRFLFCRCGGCDHFTTRHTTTRHCVRHTNQHLQLSAYPKTLLPLSAACVKLTLWFILLNVVCCLYAGCFDWHTHRFQYVFECQLQHAQVRGGP